MDNLKMNLQLDHQIFAWNKYKQIKWTNFIFLFFSEL